MKRTKADDDVFSKKIPERGDKPDEGELYIPYESLSNMMTEAFVVLDFQRKTFPYISNHALSLCGYSQEAIKSLGFNFFKEVIHLKDLPFWIEIYHTVSDSLNNDKLETDKVNYFSFILRIKNPFLSKRKSNYLKIYVKLKPEWSDNQLRYGFCLLSASVVPNSDNRLFVHYYNKDHAEYCFKKEKWTYNPYIPLGIRQKEILVWSHQGLSLKEIADHMDVSIKTVTNTRKVLFEKFGVNSITQAILYASNRRLIYHFPLNEFEIAFNEI